VPGVRGDLCASGKLDNLIYAEISQRRSEPNCDAMIFHPMAARDPDGQPLTDVELRDELITL